MQTTSNLYKEIISGEHWKEYRLVIGEKGKLITELNEPILFGGFRILTSSSGADAGFAEDIIVSMQTYCSMFPEDMPVVGE